MKKRLLNFLPIQAILALLVGLLGLVGHYSLALAQTNTNAAEIVNLKASQVEKDVFISAQIKFDLPLSIEDAMHKGVSLTFVSELDITRERWYWTNKNIVRTSRQIRISYQALTRRWRVLPWTEMASQGGLGVQMVQTYESLVEALGVAQRIHNWRAADSGELSDGSYWVTLRYRLDTSQLPKPLQIGLLGQGDWLISASTSQRLTFNEAKP